MQKKSGEKVSFAKVKWKEGARRQGQQERGHQVHQNRFFSFRTTTKCGALYIQSRGEAQTLHYEAVHKYEVRDSSEANKIAT